MDDNYFDRRLKDILEDTPEQAPTAADEADLLQRLRAVQGLPSSAIRPYWWMALALLPLLFGIGWLYQQNKVLRQQISDLTEAFNTYKKDQDTATSLVYSPGRSDTIYQVIYRDQPTTESTLSTRPAWTDSQKQSFSPGLLPLKDSRLTVARQLAQKGPLGQLADPSGTSTNPLTTAAFAADASSSTATPPEGAAMQEGPLAYLPPVAPTLLTVKMPLLTPPFPVQAPPRQGRRISPLHYLTPTGLRANLKLNAAFAFPHQLAPAALVGGSELEATFPQNRSLSLGLEWLALSFELEDPLVDYGFPTPMPPDPSARIHELQGQLDYLQIPIMLRQRFRAAKNWEPVLGVGLMAHRLWRQNYKYEYVVGGREAHANVSLRDEDFKVEDLLLSVGCDWLWGTHWVLTPELTYIYSFSDQQVLYQQRPKWSGGLRLGYKF